MKRALVIAFFLVPELAACAVISVEEYAGGSHDAGVVLGDAGAATDGPLSSLDGEAGNAGELGSGDGHDGEKTVAGEATINDYASLTAVAGNGIDVDDASHFAAGNAVLVWQTTSTEALASGSTMLDARAGAFEIARVVALTGNRLTLDRTLQIALGSPGAQVVRVPEYKSLVVSAGARIIAPAWNGSKGGIVAALVQGSITVDGTIDVTGSGFRGGTSFQENNLFNCDGRMSGAPVDGYAAKGEGLVSTSYRAEGSGDLATAPGGRGAATIGGGGGHCHNAGGGGGGNGSAGGQGGRDWSDNGVGDDVGGLGGMAVTYSARTRLVLGGGGGAGDRHEKLDTRGGAGGGVILLRANAITVHGGLNANGTTAPTKTDHDGAGGGGAGGTIALLATTAPVCDKAISARGADGASSTMSNVGPGGGGGGGHVLVAPASTSCGIDVSAGIGGVQMNASAFDGLHHGATPIARGAGVVEAP